MRTTGSRIDEKLVDALKSRLESTRCKLEAQDALADRLAELEQKRAEAREALEQAKTATEDRWEQLKRKTDDTLNDIHDAYEEVARELRK